MTECCVVVPCFNEADRLLSGEFMAFVQSYPQYRFLFVNDGSTDHTAALLEQICGASDRMHWMSLTQNSGKAAAVRKGLLEAVERYASPYVAFLDADLAIPLDELHRICSLVISDPDIQFAFMSKVPRKGAVDLPVKRYLMGRTLALMTRMSLRLPVYDTQCGCKVIRRDLVSIVMGESFISPWLFDIEMFHRLIRRFGRDWFARHAREVPLERLVERGGSRISGRHLLKLPLELWSIHRTYS